MRGVLFTTEVLLGSVNYPHNSGLTAQNLNAKTGVEQITGWLNKGLGQPRLEPVGPRGEGVHSCASENLAHIKYLLSLYLPRTSIRSTELEDGCGGF